MADQLQDIVQRMVAAGESEDNIALVIKSYKPQQAAAPTAPAKPTSTTNPYSFAAGKIAGAVKNNPVQAGAIAGGLLAAPFTAGSSLLASALGAAGGAGLGSIANAALGNEGGPKTAGDVAKTMALEGGAAAAGQGIGSGISKALKLGGKTLYKSILRPSIPLQREFGDVAEVGLREGVRVSDAGSAKVAGKLAGNSAKAKQMVADASAAGAPPIQPREVASEFGDVFQQGRRQAQLGRPDPRPAVVQRLKDFGARNPSGIPLDQAQSLKGEAQDLASRAYRAADRGGPMTDLSAEADKAMARGLRKGIEARVPGVKDVNAHSQELIGLERALEDASFRNVPGVGLVRTMLGNFAPGTASGAAIAADRTARFPFNDALKTALIAALGGGSD